MAGKNISILNDDALSHILQHLDTADRIAFAYTCKKFRNLCEDRSLLSKVDISRYSGAQQCVLKDFFLDKRMAQQIKEINLNNQCVIWQTDMDLEDFIMCCPQLEALHIIHCGIRLQGLYRILQRAKKVRTVSWSITEVSLEDIHFLLHEVPSPNGVFLENVQCLRLEIPLTSHHLEILKQIVLNHCKMLETLEVNMWAPPPQSSVSEPFNTSHSFSLDQPSAPKVAILEHLRSLMMTAVLGPIISEQCMLIASSFIRMQVFDFVYSLVKKKSRETKWGKFWISPPLNSMILGDLFHPTTLSLPASEHRLHEIDSIEAFSACVHSTLEASDELLFLFEKINDGVVRKLHLHIPQAFLHRYVEPIARIGSGSLQCLSLSGCCKNSFSQFDIRLAVHPIFSLCGNIKELDLLGCHFEENICGPLSQLKHLMKIQLHQCAIVTTYYEETLNEANSKLITLVSNCPNVSAFDIRGCSEEVHPVSHCAVEDEHLLPLAMWTNLKSLTCCNVGIRKFTFLQNITKNCKSFTMLRISDTQKSVESYLSILESARFLRHLSVHIPDLDLGSEALWKLFGNATKLERLCVRSLYNGNVNIPFAVEMLKSLSRLHVLHLHHEDAKNITLFSKQMVKAMEEEKSERFSRFEFVIQKEGIPKQYWAHNKVIPINAGELCYMVSSIALPRD